MDVFLNINGSKQIYNYMQDSSRIHVGSIWALPNVYGLSSGLYVGLYGFFMMGSSGL